MRILFLIVLTCGALFAQNVRPIPWKNSPIQASAAVKGAATAKAAQAGTARKTFFFPEDVVFPHLATGDGWETEFTFVNMSELAVDFDVYFYNPQGGELVVTLREQPAGPSIVNSAFEVSLGSGASTTVILVDTTPGQLRTGWAVVDYNANTEFRLGGHATFRQKIAGRPDFEALIPMSSYEDYAFLLPINDSAGFITAAAICNPSANLTANIQLQLLDDDGNEIASRNITLGPEQQTAVAVREWFPGVVGRYATLYVESSTDRLSAIGLRFNTGGGNSFSSVPIMNWAGIL
ncbi:MAG: hypothetical protein KJZ84_12175 [Bryobacteraceae bacterium]|nr:hypothetical protein [Bryobacteraceae bacterium]